jgi:multidrug resistance efflux pump
MKSIASSFGSSSLKDASRICIWAILMVAGAQVSLGQAVPSPSQDELPQGKEAPMEFEPELQLYDIKPERGGPTEAWAIPADVNKARAEADRAQRKAQRWQQLQRSGVLSKVEAERAALQANRAVYRFQQARVNDARKQVESIRERVAKGGSGADLLVSAEAGLKNSEALAAEAEALLRRTDLQFAQNQLDRQRRLAAAGLTPKSQVQKAQTTLERLQNAAPAPTNAAPPKEPSR